MSGLKLAVVPHEHPGEAIAPVWGRLLHKMETRIATSEGDGLRARWEFGRELLLQRKGKQLPAGLLDAVAKEVGASRAELKRRVQFAEKFPSDTEVAHACATFPSWHQMVREGLPTKREKAAPKTSPARLALRHAAALASEINTADLEEADWAAIDALIVHFTHFKAEQAEGASHAAA